MKTDKFLTKVKDVAHDLDVVSDTEWNGSSCGRCITDYKREVEFSRNLSDEELSAIKKILNDNECPGWTGVSGYKVDYADKVIYRFSTTWDSSD
jgi:hypothetical protein